MQQKTIVLTGTHQSPALELINQLKSDLKNKWKIYYIGRKFRSPRSEIITTEYELFRGTVDKYIAIDSIKLNRHEPLRSILDFYLLLKSTYSSYFYLKQIKPDLVVSLGGYISIPVLIASKILGLVSIIHEQTQTNSLTTRLSSYLVTKLALSFDNKEQILQLPKSKVVVTGNLLRKDIFQKSKININKKYFNNNKPTIYVTGGNQGSVTINKVILSILPKLIQNYNIIHQVGKYDYQNILLQSNAYTNGYICIEYFSTLEVAAILQQCDLVISRSGANICQELVGLNKKCILIPLPLSQQNEQEKNATWAKKYLENNLCIIHENNLSTKTLHIAIKTLFSLPKTKLLNNLPKGSENFMKLIYEVLPKY